MGDAGLTGTLFFFQKKYVRFSLFSRKNFQDVKSSSTPTEAGVPMVAEPSPARITLRWTVVPHTQLDGLLNPSSRLVFAAGKFVNKQLTFWVENINNFFSSDVWFKCLMLLELLNLCLSLLWTMVPLIKPHLN